MVRVGVDRILIAAVLSGALSLAGCSMPKSVGGWFGGEPATSDAKAAGQAQVYYAKMDGVRVYGLPSASSKIIGELSLHEKVTRYKVESGYAYVTADQTGLTGWVDNSMLIWRVPAAPSAAAPKPTATQPAAEEPSAAPTMPAATAAPEPPPPPSAAPARPTPTGPAPSLFDPY